MKEKIYELLKYCKENKKDSIYVLSNYLMSMEPVFLPNEIRKMDNYFQNNREELYTFIAQMLLKQFIEENDNR